MYVEALEYLGWSDTVVFLWTEAFSQKAESSVWRCIILRVFCYTLILLAILHLQTLTYQNRVVAISPLHAWLPFRIQNGRFIQGSKNQVKIPLLQFRTGHMGVFLWLKDLKQNRRSPKLCNNGSRIHWFVGMCPTCHTFPFHFCINMAWVSRRQAQELWNVVTLFGNSMRNASQ